MFRLRIFTDRSGSKYHDVGSSAQAIVGVSVECISILSQTILTEKPTTKVKRGLASYFPSARLLLNHIEFL